MAEKEAIVQGGGGGKWEEEEEDHEVDDDDDDDDNGKMEDIIERMQCIVLHNNKPDPTKRGKKFKTHKFSFPKSHFLGKET